MLDELANLAYFGNTLLEYGKALVIVLASVILGKVAYYVLNKYVKKLTEKTETKLDDLLIGAIEGPLRVAIIVAGIYFALHALILPGMGIADGLITAVFILDVIWFAIRVVDIGVQEVILPITSKSDLHLLFYNQKNVFHKTDGVNYKDVQ